MLAETRPQRPRRWFAWLAGVVGLVMIPGAATTQESEPDRVVAIGDVHGEYEGLVAILQEADLIDENLRWIGGRTTLVQTGDLVDRGPDVRKVMDLLMSLEGQATEAGGRVVVLMGNHEEMNLLGDFQDVTEKIFASFAGEDAEKLREKAWREWIRWMSQLARSRGAEAPQLSKERKAQWMKEHPPGFFEYQLAMSPEGSYGKWLLERPVMAQVGDTAFMHAGIGPDFADLSLEEVNELHRSEFQTFLNNRQDLIKQGIIPSFFNLYEINQALVYQATNPPLPQYQRANKTRLIAKAAEDLNRLQEILLQNSPLWYRGFTTLSDQELEQHLGLLEASFGAHRFVVAHSPLETGSIRQRLGGRVFLIDTGMLQSYYRGRPSALEKIGGRFSALYVNERQVLIEAEEETLPAGAAASESVHLPTPEWMPAAVRPEGPSGVLAVASYPPEVDKRLELPERVWRDPDGKALPFRTPEELQQFLSTAPIVSQEDIPEGITKPKKLLLQQDGVRAHAKFNYVDRAGQRERLVDGTVEMYFQDSYKADMAAYELSRMLGMDNVPPGVIRSVEGQKGIVQLWIENLTTYERWLQEGNTGTPSSLYLKRQIKDMRVFDLLIRNTDRNQGNITWDQDDNLWLIDHTRSLARDPNLRNADGFKGCSRALYEGLRNLDEKRMEERLSPYLGSFEGKALVKRHSKVLKLIETQIQKKGEDEILFDYDDPPKGVVIRYDEAAA